MCSRVATRQNGTVKWAQLRGAGIGAAAIKHRANNGYLHRVHRGVYITGHLALAPMARESAALLACGAGALISHRSAAYLWGLLEQAPSAVDVTLVGRRCRPKEGVRLHTVAELDRRDRREKGRLALTSPARTLIDLAAEAYEAELDRLVSEAGALSLLTNGELEAALERAGRRAGVGAMRGYLRTEQGPGFTRSEGERRMRRLTRAADLPAPVCNIRVAGWEVDFLWPAQRLVVEVDGYKFHGDRAAFERDRRKGLALVAAGYRVVRVTWRQLVDEPLRVAAKLAQALCAGC